MSRKLDISEDVLRRLYYDEELSQKEIARRLGCSPSVISSRMAEFNMQARPASRPRRVEISRETLEQLYYGERLSQADIARRLGCSDGVVCTRMAEFGLKARPTSVPGRNRRVHISKETLEQLYYGEGLNQYEIATRLGCSQAVVWRRMVENGIQARPSRLSLCLVPDHILGKWTPDLAYAVGLVATDGSLDSTDPNVVVFGSTDYELIEAYQQCLGISAHVIESRQRTGSTLYTVKLSDMDYRAFLEDVGLTTAKSRSLGPLAIPDDVFPDFLRGCVDGDGSLWVTHRDGRPQFAIQITSGSRPFLEWLRETIARLTGLNGHLYQRTHRWDLRFNGRYALALGHWIYYSPSVPCLARKRAVWEGVARG